MKHKKEPKNIQAMLPGYEDYRQQKELALARHLDKLMKMWQAGISGEKLFTAQLLIYCGLPISPTDQERVVRKARLADGSWVRVTFIRTHNAIPLPYGADRTMVYFLTNKAVVQQSPYLRWEYANEYQHLFGLNPDSGKHFRHVQERFTRVSWMDITVEYLDLEGKTVDHFKCPLIDHARISAEVDEEGNWRPAMSVSDMLAVDQQVSFGLRMFSELQRNPVPVPIELIRGAGKSWRQMDYAIFLYWRAFAGKTESFIPWHYLQEQFDQADTNPRRWRQEFKRTIALLRALPDPINQIRAEATSSGLLIKPLPVGIQFFEGQPKLGHRKEKGSLDSGSS